ncbi:MAG TPA: helix-hairpin-helix domain-containing protein [Gillisia sp.]|nr:helix-hairpin-helix domain-containing protein [Gillisia sp.]
MKFKSHFVFNRSQQTGIFLLVAIIVVLQLVYHFVDFSKNNIPSGLNEQDLNLFQKKIDSVKLAASAVKSVKIFPFNPNLITDYKGYTLGMSPEEIDRLHAYRAGDKWVNSSEEFQQVTEISDSLLQKISPYFKFPDWVTSGKPAPRLKTANSSKKAVNDKNDLNTATAEDLMMLNGIGEVLSGRIVNYRNRIGGFVADLQLKDIYGLNYELREEIQSYYTVKSPPEIKILNINEASLIELSGIPYINYELAREIINYRLLHENISNFEELAKIKEFPSEKIDRIALYLSVE